MNALSVLTVVLYMFFGFLLTVSGVDVVDKPLNFFGILILVTLIDVLSFIRAKS